VSHYNVQPVIDIYGATQGRDLGAVASDVDRIIHDTRSIPAARLLRHAARPGATMTSAYSQLYFGLAGAIVLVYLVIVVNFSPGSIRSSSSRRCRARSPASSGCCS
jgi:multidrug efflux pump subunit AcrB